MENGRPAAPSPNLVTVHRAKSNSRNIFACLYIKRLTGWQDAKQSKLLLFLSSFFFFKKKETRSMEQTGFLVFCVNLLSSVQQKTLQITNSRPPLSAVTVNLESNQGLTRSLTLKAATTSPGILIRVWHYVSLLVLCVTLAISNIRSGARRSRPQLETKGISGRFCVDKSRPTS